MKSTELRNKTRQELNDLIVSLLEEQFQLRMRATAEVAPKNHLYGKVRKNIARVKTVLNELIRA